MQLTSEGMLKETEQLNEMCHVLCSRLISVSTVERPNQCFPCHCPNSNHPPPPSAPLKDKLILFMHTHKHMHACIHNWAHSHSH